MDTERTFVINTEEINHTLADAHPKAILRWAWLTFGAQAAASSSFQTQSIPLLHMIAQSAPGMTIFFLDTGFHFPETIHFRDRLWRKYGLNIVSLAPEMGHDGFRYAFGELYQRDPDRCCGLNKVEPLERARQRFKAWISGIRRDQTATRADTPIVSLLDDGTYKICPLARWTKHDVGAYAREHKLLEHPLTALGYASIGCAPCTQPISAGEDERAGRWTGTGKTECGLHFPHKPQIQLALG